MVKMPKAKQKSNKTNGEDGADEDVSSSQARMSMTQAQRAVSSVSEDELERRVVDLVRYLLILDQKKIPIKRQDISKNVLKEHSKGFPLFMKRAQQKLKVFGIEVVEVDIKQQKSFILVSSIEQDQQDSHIQWPETDNQHMAVVMVILSLIFMNGNVLTDSLLWHTLKRMGIDADTTHEVFGDVKKLITQEFVRQGYIEYLRQPNTDPPRYELKWGPRAKCETTKHNVLKFVCEIYKDITPQQWTSQWQDVVRSEGVENGSDEVTEIS